MSEYELSKADALVIFGITGDLAKKMTFQALYRMETAKVLDCPIIGVAVNEWSLDQLRDAMHAGLLACGETVKGADLTPKARQAVSVGEALAVDTTPQH